MLKKFFIHEARRHCAHPFSSIRFGRRKTRPALVIAVAPGRHADLLLALITSQTQQAVPQFDELIETDDSDYRITGLKARSVVRLARLASVEADVINARLGRISAKRLTQIKGRLSDWLRHG